MIQTSSVLVTCLHIISPYLVPSSRCHSELRVCSFPKVDHVPLHDVDGGRGMRFKHKISVHTRELESVPSLQLRK